MDASSVVDCMGRIITFYSYKGGTGRSMALANVAWVLASNGRKVLVIDWDLEAPGLHRYFAPFLLDPELSRTEGLIEFVRNFEDETLTPPFGSDENGGLAETNDEQEGFDEWRSPTPAPLDSDRLEELSDIRPYAVALNYSFPREGRLDFVPAGRQDANYSARVTSFDWDNFYQRLGGGPFFEACRRQLMDQYDYVLIDSRTGICDTSGICTIQLPDTLVVCFTANNQSITGAAAVTESVKKYWSSHQRANSAPIKIFPLFTRVESAEKEKLRLRKQLAHAEFTLFLDHIPESQREVYWGGVQVPYAPFYAYEELLATFGDTPREVGTVLYAMERLTAYLSEEDVQGQVTQLIPPTPEQRREVLALYAKNKLQSGEVTNVSTGTTSGSTGTYDAFVLYSSSDRGEVEPLIRRLKKAGARLWFDMDEILAGEEFRSAYRRAGDRCRLGLVFVGQGEIGDFNAEILDSMLRRQDATGVNFRVVPVILPNGATRQLPAGLESIKAVELKALADDEARVKELLNVVIQQPSLNDANVALALDKPYPGARPYNVQDSTYFFGRREDTRRILERLADSQRSARDGRVSAWTSRTVVLSGSTQCGKTSLVLASLLPALARGEVEGSARWQQLVIRPGTDPLGNLAVALSSLPEFSASLSRSRELVDAMRKDKSGLQLALRLAVGALAEYRVRQIVIDQFEEVYTMCADAGERRAYLDNLLTAIRETDDGFRWLLVVNSHYVDQLSAEPGWTELFPRSVIAVEPPTQSQLREIIARPAELKQVFVERELVESMVEDYEKGDLNLALCQVALRSLWEHRRDGNLRLVDYLNDGGASRWSSQYFERLFLERFGEDQNAVRRILLRCYGSDSRKVTIRRPSIEREEFLTRGKPPELLEAIVQQLVDEDFLEVVPQTAETPNSLRIGRRVAGKWERLEAWLYEYHADISFRHRLTEAAAESAKFQKPASNNEWQSRYIPKLLWFILGLRSDVGIGWVLAGDEFEQVAAWAEEHEAWLNDSEWNCLQRSRQIARSRKYIVGFALLYFLLVMAVGGFSVARWLSPDDTEPLLTQITTLEAKNGQLEGTVQSIQEKLDVAEATSSELEKEVINVRDAHLETRSLLLVQQAESVIGFRREVGLLLAIEAARILPKDRSTWPIEKVLRENLGERQWSTLFTDTNIVNQKAAASSMPLFGASEYGSRVVVGSPSEARLVDLNLDPRQIRPLILQPEAAQDANVDPSSLWKSLAISPNEKSLCAVAAHANSPGKGVAHFWKITAGGEVKYDGAKQIALSGGEVQATILTGEARRLFMLSRPAARSESRRDGEGDKQILVESLQLDVWNLDKVADSPNPVVTERNVVSAAASRNERWLAWGTQNGSILLWDLLSSDAKPRIIPLSIHKGPVTDLVFSADGRRLFSAGGDQSVVVWELNPDSTLPTWTVATRHDAPVISLDVSQDGDFLLSGSTDGELRQTKMSSMREVVFRSILPSSRAITVARIAVTEPELRLATVDDEGSMIIWNASIQANNAERGANRYNAVTIPRLPSENPPKCHLIASRDGRWLLAVGEDVRLLPLRLDDLVKLAEKDASRQLTSEERQEFRLP